MQRLQVSAAIGAFLVGTAISGPIAEQSHRLLAPLRDLFAATFFFFFGLEIDPASLRSGAAGGRRLGGLAPPSRKWAPDIGRRGAKALTPAGRWRAGAVLVARGEFSIVIAGLGVGIANPGSAPWRPPMYCCWRSAGLYSRDWFASGGESWPKTTTDGWSRPFFGLSAQPDHLVSMVSLWYATCNCHGVRRRAAMKKNRIGMGILTGALMLMGLMFTASTANAQRIGFGVSVGPGYYAPPPVAYAAPAPYAYAPVRLTRVTFGQTVITIHTAFGLAASGVLATGIEASTDAGS